MNTFPKTGNIYMAPKNQPQKVSLADKIVDMKPKRPSVKTVSVSERFELENTGWTQLVLKSFIAGFRFTEPFKTGKSSSKFTWRWRMTQLRNSVPLTLARSPYQPVFEKLDRNSCLFVLFLDMKLITRVRALWFSKKQQKWMIDIKASDEDQAKIYLTSAQYKV